MSNERPFVWVRPDVLQRLSVTQVGAFGELVIRHEENGGFLPREASKLAAIVGVKPREWRKIWTAELSGLFKAEGDILRLIQPTESEVEDWS